ncbi:MAG: helix-turn-helix domain-containing protein [Hormoscilla sp. GM7CHS1pb]|nr:helix-turn-helix domain-containing protein [Hormoscilla sp. GM7CHS1pb]
MKHEYYTPAQAANLLGVHPESLRRWEREGKITSYRTPGGQLRCPPGAFNCLLCKGLKLFPT